MKIYLRESSASQGLGNYTLLCFVGEPLNWRISTSQYLTSTMNIEPFADRFENSLSRSWELEQHPSLISRSLTDRGDIKSTNRDPFSSVSEENIGFIIRGNTPLCCRHTPLCFLLINQRQICQTSIQDFVYRARYQHQAIQINQWIYSFSIIWVIFMKL